MNIKIGETELKKKIGQMMMLRNPYIFKDDAEAIFKNGFTCGSQVCGQNSKEELAEIRKISPNSIFFAADMEYGFTGDTFNGTLMPCQMTLGAVNSEDYAYEWAAVAAREARNHGVNFVFGPVVDLANEPRQPLANIRCISSDKNDIVKLGAAIIKGYQDNGMQVAAKHYPGAGRFDNDSHIEAAILNCSREVFENEELFIYKELIHKCNLSGIMTGHVAINDVDGTTPATVSRKLISYLDKFNFKGLLITDSLAMKGIKNDYPINELLIKAILAGHDIVLCDYSESPLYQLELLYKAARDKIISAERIDRSFEKIGRMLKIISNTEIQKPDPEKHRILSEEISRKSITIDGDRNYLSCATDKKTLFIITKESHNEVIGAELKMGGGNENILSRVKSCFPGEVLSISDNPGPLEIEKCMNKALEHDSIVFIGYALPYSYKGTSDFSKSILAMIRGLRKKIKLFVLIGNPFAARELPDLPCIVYGYHGGFAEKETLECIAGKFDATGKLPVCF